MFFMHQHRADVRPNTSTFVFAEPCVFSKQSPPPILKHFLYSSRKKKAMLPPKSHMHFAEFLCVGSI